jgi:hypothetical protein
MTHGDSVAYPDYRKLYRHPPGKAYPVGGGPGNIVQVQMPRNNLAFGNRYTD